MELKKHKFEDLAKADNWITLGGWLNILSREFETYGFAYAQDAIQAVAEVRGTKAASLRNQMSAAAWLKKNYPNVYKRKPTWLGMMQVVLLSRLEAIDPVRAKEIAQGVFRGEVSQAEMKRILDDAQNKQPQSRQSQSRIRGGAQRRTHKFEKVVKEFLQENSKQFFGHDDIEVVDGRLLEPLGTDILVKVNAEPYCAVEIRGPRARIDPSYIVDQLARAALILRYVPHLIYAVPESLGHIIPQMIEMRDKLEIGGIFFATIPEKEKLEYGDFTVTD
ncbi:hypothetical protein [Primorskyibacter sp. S87]|uniref:hypothetical protein n=1 Tax=Primorskyibacter sp. S87 TaxID=3415126 RepID=UPI003C7AFC85